MGFIRLITIILIIHSVTGCQERSPKRLQELRQKLHSAEVKERNEAALELGRFGVEAESAVPELIKILTTDNNRGVRTSAAFSLRAIGTKEAIEALDNYKK